MSIVNVASISAPITQPSTQTYLDSGQLLMRRAHFRGSTHSDVSNAQSIWTSSYVQPSRPRVSTKNCLVSLESAGKVGTHLCYVMWWLITPNKVPFLNWINGQTNQTSSHMLTTWVTWPLTWECLFTSHTRWFYHCNNNNLHLVLLHYPISSRCSFFLKSLFRVPREL